MGLIVLVILAAAVLATLGLIVNGLGYLVTIAMLATVLALTYGVARFFLGNRRRRRRY